MIACKSVALRSCNAKCHFKAQLADAHQQRQAALERILGERQDATTAHGQQLREQLDGLRERTEAEMAELRRTTQVATAGMGGARSTVWENFFPGAGLLSYCCGWLDFPVAMLAV